MAMLDNNDRPSNILPSINHVGPDNVKSIDMDRRRLPTIPMLSISTSAKNSPVDTHSGLPTSNPLSSTSTAGMHDRPGHPSPAESASRRSTREETEPLLIVKSLPSIHEALGNRSILNPPTPPDPVRPPGSSPVRTTTTASAAATIAASVSFPDRPSGPFNPFAHSNFNPSSTKQDPSTDSRRYSSGGHDHPPPFIPHLAHVGTVDAKPPQHNSHAYPVSPRASLSSIKGKDSSAPDSSTSSHFPATAPPPYQPDSLHYHSTTLPYNSQSSSLIAKTPANILHEPIKKLDESRDVGYAPPYGETVKRHLEVYDTEVAFNEISDASLRTLDVARYWTQKFHQSNRSHHLAEGIPPLHDVDEAIRQCHKMMENLHRIREASIAQQTTVSEGRAQAAHAPPNDQYRGIIDDYKGSSFAMNDSKKRRGKAAPPGRCHSCNRAETPEWRRGPDGARTLCNACGLHYAKLTRKMGANKTGHMTASSLRPKGLDGRP